MRGKSGKRWILAVLLVVVFPALAVHVSCVAVMGPGSWGSGMEEKAPGWIPLEPDSPAAAYVRQFASRERPEPLSLPDSVEVQGEQFWVDYAPSENLGIVATYEGVDWADRQRFFVWREGGRPAEGPAGGAQVQELDLPREMILERPVWMVRGGVAYLVVGRWQPWTIPPLEKLSRYLKTYTNPALLPERSLYVYRLPSGPLEYWGPGHTLKPSPDRRYGILLRSGALAAGYYSLHLWDFERDSLSTMVSLRDAEQSSGRSFDYEWSDDSRAIHVTGATGGFERRGGAPRSLDLIWIAGEEGFYDLEAEGSGAANAMRRVRTASGRAY